MPLSGFDTTTSDLVADDLLTELHASKIQFKKSDATCHDIQNIVLVSLHRSKLLPV